MSTNRKLAIGAAILVAIAAVIAVAVLASRGRDDAGEAATTTLPPPTTSTTVETTTTTTAATSETTATPTTNPVTTDDPAELAALRDAYRQGFEQTCRAIFGLSPDGQMEDPEDPGTFWSLDECLSEMDVTTGEIYDTVQDAFDGGIEDAEFTADSFTASGRLCSRTGRCWSS
ncbi:hypothetical protein [Rhabdothermincola sp.]|uniref:hypothetical protein n=1 Tax=Rhabdothermincola sp. TaxID=2820405 RepID=UPI002FE20712